MIGESKKIILGVTGGIAIHKSLDLVSQLVKRGGIGACRDDEKRHASDSAVAISSHLAKSGVAGSL